MNPPIIELKDVTKRFPATRRSGEVLAMEGLNLAVEDRRAATPDGGGEFVVLLGPSGCGKSTILSLISGLALPESGSVTVYGQPVTGPHKYSATVPQAYTCFPWLNALQNVEFGLDLQSLPDGARRGLAIEYLTKVGLAEFAGAYHRQLSGGMQQRVAIARTLALKRPIVLMDEPFGALDAQTRAEMQQMLLQLWEEEKNTIIFVTHDITEALLLADRVIVFSPRPAKVLHDMVVPFPFQRPPEIVHDREFVHHAEFLRQLLGQHKQPVTLAPPPGVGLARLVSRRVKSVPAAGTGSAAPTARPGTAVAAPSPWTATPATAAPALVHPTPVAAPVQSLNPTGMPPQATPVPATSGAGQVIKKLGGSIRVVAGWAGRRPATGITPAAPGSSPEPVRAAAYAPPPPAATPAGVTRAAVPIAGPTAPPQAVLPTVGHPHGVPAFPGVVPGQPGPAGGPPAAVRPPATPYHPGVPAGHAPPTAAPASASGYGAPLTSTAATPAVAQDPRSVVGPTPILAAHAAPRPGSWMSKIKGLLIKSEKAEP